MHAYTMTHRKTERPDGDALETLRSFHVLNSLDRPGLSIDSSWGNTDGMDAAASRGSAWVWCMGETGTVSRLETAIVHAKALGIWRLYLITLDDWEKTP